MKWGFPKRAPESSGWLFRERCGIMNPREQGCVQRGSDRGCSLNCVNRLYKKVELASGRVKPNSAFSLVVTRGRYLWLQIRQIL